MLENQELEPRALALETWQMVPDEKFDAFARQVQV